MLLTHFEAGCFHRIRGHKIMQQIALLTSVDVYVFPLKEWPHDARQISPPTSPNATVLPLVDNLKGNSVMFQEVNLIEGMPRAHFCNHADLALSEEIPRHCAFREKEAHGPWLTAPLPLVKVHRDK